MLGCNYPTDIANNVRADKSFRPFYVRTPYVEREGTSSSLSLSRRRRRDDPEVISAKRSELARLRGARCKSPPKVSEREREREVGISRRVKLARV